MKTRALATASLALALTACTTEFAAISFTGLCAPPVPEAGGVCMYAETCDAYFHGNGVLDATTGGASAVDFRIPVEITNSLQDNADKAAGRVNTNDATIQSLEVTYEGATLPAWTVPMTAFIPTAGSTVATLRLIEARNFPAIAPVASTRQMMVRVRAHGVLASQTSFTTAWLEVPVLVCSGCLSGAWCPAGQTLTASCPSSGAAGPVQMPSTPLCE